LLANWVPNPNAKRPAHYLELVSPSGALYLLYRLPADTFGISDWSGDGTRALLVGSSKTSSTVRVVDLETGTIVQHFTLPNETAVFASFTRPRGLALLVDHGLTGGLTRYSLNGVALTRFPGRFGGLGRFTSSWLASPDGTQLVFGAWHGLAIYGNTGRLIAQLPVRNANDCQPVRWWSPTEVLATCVQDFRHVGQVGRLLRFSIGGGQPEPLTRPPTPPDLGDLDAWRVAGQTYVESTTGCGYGFLSLLQADGTKTLVRLPHLEPLNTTVVTTTPDSMALLSDDSCVGGPVVDWYTPASGSVLRVLGPPIQGGMIKGVIGYPDPSTAVGPFYGG
jgi:TolB protein